MLGRRTLGVRQRTLVQEVQLRQRWQPNVDWRTQMHQALQQGDTLLAAYAVEAGLRQRDTSLSGALSAWLTALSQAPDSAWKAFIGQRILALTMAYPADSIQLMYWARAHAQRALGQRMEAVMELVTLLQHDSLYMPAHLELARLFIKIGNYERATEHIMVVLKQNPDHPLALALLEQLRNQLADSLHSENEGASAAPGSQSLNPNP